MSNIAIKGGATGAGVFTLESPSTNTDRTLVLPDEAGTVLTSTSNLAAAKITGALPAIDGSALTGVSGGKVLQVVSTADSTQRSTTSSSFVSSGMSVTITPTSATSKIFVQFCSAAYKNFNPSGFFTIYRDATNLALAANHFTLLTVPDKWSPIAMSFLDSPSSTSALTYEIYYRMSGTGNIYLNAATGGATVGTITVMEIAG